MLAGLMLAGCQSRAEIQAELGRTCQFKECTCVGQAENSWLPGARQRNAVLWTTTGEATCAAGSNLVLLDDPTRRAGLGKPKTGIHYEMKRRQNRKRTGW